MITSWHFYDHISDWRYSKESIQTPAGSALSPEEVHKENSECYLTQLQPTGLLTFKSNCLFSYTKVSNCVSQCFCLLMCVNLQTVLGFFSGRAVSKKAVFAECPKVPFTDFCIIVFLKLASSCSYFAFLFSLLPSILMLSSQPRITLASIVWPVDRLAQLLQ